MGYDVSWAAFNKVCKQDALVIAGLRDTGQPDEANEAPFSCAELPIGWTVLWANDSTYAYNYIKTLSASHTVLSLTIQEFATTSLVSFHVRGRMMWCVSHEGTEDLFNLSLTGVVPPQTAAIRDRMLALQQSENQAPRVDHMYNVAIELAESICGYRHDRWQFAWGQPLFTVAEPIRG